MMRKPHLWRMAWRNIWRQKKTSLLTAFGLAVSTALMTMTLISTAALKHSLQDEVKRQFGNIAFDIPSVEQQMLKTPIFFAEDIAKVTASYADTTPEGAELLPIVSGLTTLIRKDEAGGRVGITTHLHAIGFDLEAAIRFDPGLAPLLKEELGPSELILSERAAKATNARAGDSVYLLDASTREHRFTVKDVVPERGMTGYRGLANANATVLVRADDARLLSGTDDEGYTNLLVTDSNPSEWRAVPVRATFEKERRDAAAFVTVIFGLTSGIAVIIGIVLMTNIFKMIADERKLEMGILRVIGLGRRDLTALLTMEGLLYGIFSGLIGVAAGAGFAYLLLFSIGNMITGTAFDREMFASFYVEPQALLTGFAIGLLIVLLCVWNVARKAAKASIIKVLGARDTLPSHRHSLLNAWASVLSVIAVAGIIASTAVPDFRSEWISEDNLGLVIVLVLLTVPFFVLLLAQYMRFLCDGLLRIFRRSATFTMILRLAFRNLNESRTRTGLLLLMFASIACFISLPIVYHSVMMQSLKGPDPRELVGQYDLVARIPRALKTEEIERQLREAGYSGERQRVRLAAVQQVTWKEQPTDWGTFQLKANGIDSSFAETNRIPLVKRDARFADDREAWSEIANDGSVVIVSEDALRYEEGRIYQIGDPYTIKIDDRAITKTIVGIAKTTGYHPESYGAWLKRGELAALTKGENEITSTVLVMLEKPDAKLQKEIISALSAVNIAPVSNIAEMENSYYYNMMAIISLFRWFNQFAMLIGLTGLLVVMYRLIRQRRQRIGMLRAVGLTPAQVYGVLLAEGAFLAGIGVTLGFAIGVYMSAIIFDAMFRDGYFADLALPYATLFLAFAGTLAVSLAISCLPAGKAQRVPPTEATRYVG
ncbi:ABC transporter permease [Paenibacillus cymbidii]|uniref:ABC transporter permease n=1 Tax=Paenibacillus cymbidii TaxID=1639034 RepID=UPI0010801EE1|nr:ABC transporter permease [Paenibacillus cymbidii]